jgi:hypothetical protein
MKPIALCCEELSACSLLRSLSHADSRERRREQRCVRAGRGAPLRRSSLRADCPVVLVLVARRPTHFAHCVRAVQTGGDESVHDRAARVATSPALRGASMSRRGLPARTFAATAAVFSTNKHGGGLRGRRCPVGAIWVATSSAGPGSARAQHALRQLTRRNCLNAESAASEVSFAARPWTEQRSAVDAQRRPPPYEPPPGSACRDTLSLEHRPTTAMGRKQTPQRTPASRKVHRTTNP